MKTQILAINFKHYQLEAKKAWNVFEKKNTNKAYKEAKMFEQRSQEAFDELAEIIIEATGKEKEEVVEMLLNGGIDKIINK